MKLQTLKNAVTSRVARQILVLDKHSPTILFVGGVAGAVGATVLACKATLKVEEILEDAEKKTQLVETTVHKDYSDEDRRRDLMIVKLRTAGEIAMLYAPAIAVGAVSILCLTKSHTILSERNAALMAAYSALDKGFREYRARVRDELGEEKDHEFRHGRVIDGVEVKKTKDGGKELTVVGKHTPSVYARWFDDSSTEWKREPEYNMAYLQCQQSYANHLLNSRGHVFLNEVYDALGIKRSKAGAVVGWVLSKNGDRDNYIDFGIFDETRERVRAFVNGHEGSILLDFNVDGVIYDLLDEE